jgi:hypothetical protein
MRDSGHFRNFAPAALEMLSGLQTLVWQAIPEPGAR